MTQAAGPKMDSVRTAMQDDLPAGLIDIHSHLIPAVDDGCADIEESIRCINVLQGLGYVGSVCTPHLAMDFFPQNTTQMVKEWTQELEEEIRVRGLKYRVWPGGELRLSRDVVGWMQDHGVPTLANSRCVLVDMWERDWPGWTVGVFEWLLANGYQPILAHPERMVCENLDGHLRQLEGMGVWLQGNFRCMTGEEGHEADKMVRQLLIQKRYQLLAMDMHGPDSLEGRIEGLRLVETEFGKEVVSRLTGEAPRRWIL